MKKLIIILLTIPLYLLTINLISSDFSINEYINPTVQDTTNINLGVNEVVDVTINRNRWYGQIYENLGENPSKKLYLFNLIPIPLEQKNSYLISHLTYLSLLIISISIVLILNSFDSKENSQTE